jgi:hypothetical protein
MKKNGSAAPAISPQAMSIAANNPLIDLSQFFIACSTLACRFPFNTPRHTT